MFVLRMAAREARASWRRLLFFFVCIAVGVASIVALRSVIQSVRAVFGQEARSLIAADVLISTNREWTPEARHAIETRLGQAHADARTETVETPTMVRPTDARRATARMVELRAVQEAFPLYGTIRLADGTPYTHALLRGRGAIVRPELLTALGVQVGEQIQIGQAAFTIRGVLLEEPGRRVSGFSLGPRVLVDFDDLTQTALLSFGSRARRVVLVRVAESGIDPLVESLTRDFRDEFVTARSYRGSDDEVGRDFERAENYLSLVGLVIVVLGGISVSSVTRVFIAQKMRSIAVLKCLGATSGQVMAVYLLQVLTLGLAGSLLGVALAAGAVAGVPWALGDSRSLLADVQYGVTASASAQGVGIGVLVSMLFSLVPLLAVRDVKPSLLLREESPRPSLDWTRVVVLGLVALALVTLTAWQVSSWRIGLIVSAGFAVLALVLQGAGRVLVVAIAPLARVRSFPVRHAVLHLSRPGNQTRVILLAVGLGAFFIVGVRSLQTSLLGEFSLQLSASAPDMFLMDIQTDQAEALRSFVSGPEWGTGAFQLIPVMRARVTGVEGREVDLESYEDVRARGSLAREYTITYRDRLESNERLVDGAFWTGPSTDPEVSIERGIHERFRIDVGDRMRFDILGRKITARVTSVREVEWKDSRNGGFMFVFRPGVLDQAPHTYLAPLRGPSAGDARARLQHALVERFPNVTVIDFREILLTVQDVMSKVTLAISVVGGLVLFSGVLILIGAVAMTKYQRVYEAAVLKTLGARRQTIARMLLFEYGVLGILAGLVGSLGAVALTWGVSRFALEIPWRVALGEHAQGVVITAVLVAVIGVASSLDVLANRPLATLRRE